MFASVPWMGARQFPFGPTMWLRVKITGEIADSSATLAIGGAYFTSDTRVVNGISYWRITKGMVVTDNPASKYSGMSIGCYEELLAHELGHAIGFGHAAARPAVAVQP